MISKNIILVLLVAIFVMTLSLTVTYFGEVYGKDVAIDENDVATNMVIRISSDGGAKESTYYTFSKIGYVRGAAAEFSLWSLPSKDKAPFYELVQDSLNRPLSTPSFNVHIDLMSTNGTIIETLNYKRCNVEEYFVTVNDSKGKYSFLEDQTARLEIRDITKFACFSFSIEV